MCRLRGSAATARLNSGLGRIGLNRVRTRSPALLENSAFPQGLLNARALGCDGAASGNEDGNDDRSGGRPYGYAEADRHIDG